MKHLDILALFFLFPTLLFTQTIYHVNTKSPGSQQTGLTWDAAFITIQAALTAAKQGDEIWVAEGVYYPTATTDRAASFALKQGVRLYGGFAGMETALNQRNFTLHETVLSGNIGDTTIRTDNSYSVVTGQGLDSTACLDGFVVRNGYAEGQGGAILLRATASTPLTCPVIRNCRIEYNYAASGAGLNCQWNSVGIVSPVLQNCRFQFNVAQQSGGAVYKSGPSPAGHPFRAEDCIFNDNRALNGNLGGGGVYFYDPSGFSIFRRCIFERDTAIAGIGGGICHPIPLEMTELHLDSCIFRANIADAGAGVMYEELSNFFVSGTPFHCVMNKCVFEQNTTRSGPGAAFEFYGFEKSVMRLTMDNCQIINNLTYSVSTCVFHAAKDSDIELVVRNSQFIGNAPSEDPTFKILALQYIVAGTDSKCRADIQNCVFARNSAGIQGVGNYPGVTMDTYINNCTFYKNGRPIIEKSWNKDFNDSTFYNNMYISNCIFWENSPAYSLFSDAIINVWEMEGYHIDHVFINWREDLFLPGSIGPHARYETDPVFVDTANNDFRLRPCSPAVNFGDNQAVNIAGLTLDINGNPRIVQDTVDIGAYEAQDTCTLIAVHENPEPKPAIGVYPNPAPAGSRVDIRAPAYESGAYSWEILDMSGRQCAEGSCSDAMPGIVTPSVPGIYWLKITAKQLEQVVKMVVIP